ncbi:MULTISPECIES: undecaprenyldiphospho-muramoylpentapeptide beta-N-acetylglucosaminyltransferase [Kocuria]|uniref:UDP-N-acetylglucosamine--N-acetylmuramyl-(pentapeptide) pyrophosphoryl-undecaprenol N-acetylglucosamine transferase n=1 Tax=Kocuria rosea subsp. polaris TaxID=136273 RepID=A0A0A6YD82_KOCRO|nr:MULTISPECIES: undecaprenyldiphospho-muramoylpentapeptide beta-N-acetylglucosaminyltransferase [Kocuria]EYT50868.1 UDP-diphospho-muramoylpentapeptide beta-N-acetylglucosaminyltransferase [Kocuria sp. UCD-OTCP]KHD98732.1 UDP-diphospho-muramoylpentapeptide beta-N-acetylglucosaminyltransferase [Kocuria polaris]PWF86403.1 undecaprenyldiphospho-muramoylpentapeptide beta-N-acetylglucosaminyltransferase [Kocuria rosea]STX01687.1 UDP-N-acetylglucosamine--N-acetylmuramyl-(pentapeptide) pyrophosphoryl-
MTPSEPTTGGPAPSVLLAGGGTAGHVSPLLAVAAALREQAPAARLTAVGTASGMETRLVPQAGLELELVDRVPLPRRPSVDLVRLPGRLLGAVRQAGEILDRVRPDVVLGVGGYVCTPVYLAAARRGLPIVVHEANARPGLANRVGARWARTVAAAFPGTPLRGAVTVGMPMRREISHLDREALRAEARRSFGLDPDLPTVVVTGGSSGALAMNRTVAGVVGEVAARGYQLLHVTGRGKQLTRDDGAPLSAPGYVQVEYVDGMERVYAAADLLVARAGAATVSEVAAVGLPAVFVPLPVGNGEQALNAASLVAAGAAQLVADDAFTPDWYRRNVHPLLADPGRLAAMAAASRAHGVRDADTVLARMILEEVPVER